MAAPSVTYTFVNATAADATQVNTNFSDLVSALSDGSKDLTISALGTATLTVSGAALFNGTVGLGNATSDDITITGYIASDILPKTAGTASLGSSTQTWEDLYLDEGATNGGTVYFNAGTTSYIQSSADGATLTVGGFTGTTLPAITSAGALTISDATTGSIIGGTTKAQYNGGNIALQVVGTDPVARLGVYRYSADASGPYIIFGKSRHATLGSMTYPQSGDQLGLLIFGTASESTGSIESAGYIRMRAAENHSATARGSYLDILTVANTGATAGAALTLGNDKSATFYGLIDTGSTGQIKFPATQNASSDANTLDDYERGTWTPSIGGTATYNAQVGRYTKIGNKVTVWFYLAINVIGTGSTITISGLPFTVTSAIACSGCLDYWAVLASTYVYVVPVAGSSATTLDFNTAAAATAGITLQTAIFQNSSSVRGSITYYI